MATESHGSISIKQSDHLQITILVSAFAFISPLFSSMIAPALSHVGDGMHISSGVQLQMMLSIFVLAYSFGPFVLSPCSEIWGRTRIIQCANLAFIVLDLACGFARSKGELTAFRFIAGLGGSATLDVRLCPSMSGEVTADIPSRWVVELYQTAGSHRNEVGA